MAFLFLLTDSVRHWKLHTAQCPVWTVVPGYPRPKFCPLVSLGYRMSAPQHCPEDIFKIMMKCWDYKPENRPKFSELQKELTVIKKKITSWRSGVAAASPLAE